MQEERGAEQAASTQTRSLTLVRMTFLSESMSAKVS